MDTNHIEQPLEPEYFVRETGGLDKNKISEMISTILKLNIKLDVTIQIRMIVLFLSFAPYVKSPFIRAPNNPLPTINFPSFVSKFPPRYSFKDIDWVQTEKHVFETASNHPFLVGLHSCFQTPSRLFFVIEFVRGGDLMFHMQVSLFDQI